MRNEKEKIEEFCKAKFDEFLRERVHGSIYWYKVSKENEPPDYYLCLNETKYAVEVTTLVEKFNRSDSMIGIIKSLDNFVKRVESEAKKKVFLNGTYLIDFYEDSIRNFSKNRKKLIKDLLGYIKETKSKRTSSKEVFPKESNRICSIRKAHDKENKIIMGAFIRARWEEEIKEEICELLKERINTKYNKLIKILEPKILLLYDAYRWGNHKMFEFCKNRMTHLNSFHTIFIVQDNGSVWIFHSKNLNWINQNLKGEEI